MYVSMPQSTFLPFASTLKAVATNWRSLGSSSLSPTGASESLQPTRIPRSVGSARPFMSSVAGSLSLLPPPTGRGSHRGYDELRGVRGFGRTRLPGIRGELEEPEPVTESRGLLWKLTSADGVQEHRLLRAVRDDLEANPSVPLPNADDVARTTRIFRDLRKADAKRSFSHLRGLVEREHELLGKLRRGSRSAVAAGAQHNERDDHDGSHVSQDSVQAAQISQQFACHINLAEVGLVT